MEAKKEKNGKQNRLKFILRKLIIDAGLNDIQLARASGIPYTTLNQLLNSDTVSPKVETIKPIAKYFNISIEQLIGDKPLDSKESTQILSEQPKKFKEWVPDLYIKCIESSCEVFKKIKRPPGAEEALTIIKEIYFYSLSKGGTIDPVFIEWFIEHSLNQQTCSNESLR
jgi:transcriptional regulator with XRE-family HTH domain